MPNSLEAWLAKKLKDLTIPFQVEPGEMGLDCQDQAFIQGIESAIIAVADALQEYGPNPSFDRVYFIKKSGHSMKDLPDEYRKLLKK